MDNLTQTQQDAKQADFNQQATVMLNTYRNTDTSERNTVINQKDSFLEIVPNDAKIFWLEFRCKLERLNKAMP